MSEPTGTVTVAPSPTVAIIRVAGSTLMFTTVNWDTPQTVTGRARDDDFDEDQETEILDSAVSGGGYGSTEEEAVTITIIDNDTTGVTITPLNPTVDQGSTAGFTIRLNSEPASQVVFNLMETSPDFGLDFLSISVSTGSWSTPMPIDVTAGSDDDANDKTGAIIVEIFSDDLKYNALADITMNVTVTDDETTAIILSETSRTVGEGTSTVTYTVALNAEPASNMTVNIVSNNTDVTVGDSSLDFTTMNWETTQTVTIEAAEDDDAVIDMAVLTHSTTTNSRDGDSYGATTLDVNVTENDSRGVTISQTTDRAVGEGAQFTYTIVLDSEPTGPVSVNIGESNPNAVMLAPKTHTFVQSGTFAWNVPQTIRVMGQDNIIDHPSDLISTITHTLSAASSDYASETAGFFVVTVTDNDTVEVVITRQSLTVAEGDNDVYFVSLRTRPSSGAVVVVLSDNHDEIMASPAMMTFDTNNYHIGQQVTVSNPQNSVDEDEESATITHMVSSGPAEYTGIPASDIPSVSVTLPDDDTRDITVSQSALTILEVNTDAYTIVLLSAQADRNTVAFTPPSLAFDDSDWNTAKTITVTAEDDRIDESTGETWDITHTVTGADYGANNVPAAPVAITVTDDDVRGVIVNPTSLNVTEGRSLTYDVVLTSQPTATVTVTIATSGEGTLTANMTSLTFTAADWDMTQEVAVSAAADDDSASNETATFAHTVSGGDYTATPALTVDSVVANTVDNDSNNISVSKSTVTFAEDGSDTYTLRLTTDPEATVTLSVSVTSGRETTLST